MDDIPLPDAGELVTIVDPEGQARQYLVLSRSGGDLELLVDPDEWPDSDPTQGV